MAPWQAGGVRIPASVVLAVILRPTLWATAGRAVLRLARPGWWRRWPPLPTVPPGYATFRAVTARGGSDPAIEADDLVAWLKWCRVNAEHLH